MQMFSKGLYLEFVSGICIWKSAWRFTEDYQVLRMLDNDKALLRLLDET